MKTFVLWALVGLNVLLLFAFFGRMTGSDAAYGQRRPGEYLLVPGQVSGRENDGVVYIIDVTNGVLSAMSYDEPRREISAMPPINLARVFSPEGDGALTPDGQNPPRQQNRN